MTQVVHLPVFPIKVYEAPTVEDWQEYAIELSKSLQVFSTWIEDELRELIPKISTVVSQSYTTLEQTKDTKQPAKVSLLLDAEDVLIPMGDLHWWESSKDLANRWVISDPLPAAPTHHTTSFMDQNNSLMNSSIHGDNVTVLTPPLSDFVNKRQAQYESIRNSLSPPPDPHSPFRLVLKSLAHVRGPESVQNMTMLNHLLHMINLYYLDCLSVHTLKMSDVWTHSDQKSRMNYQGMIFLEMMHLRILRQVYSELYIPPSRLEQEALINHNPFAFSKQFKFTLPPTPQQLLQESQNRDMTVPIRLSEQGAAYRQLACTNKTFPWLFERKLVLERPSPISDYTQSEVELSLTNLFFKFSRMEWHSELHHFVNILMDRLAVLFYNVQPEKIMNLEKMRIPIPVAVQEQLNESQGRTPKLEQGMQVMYSYNFEFLYRCCWRYYYAMQNVLGFEQLIREPIPLFTPSIPKQTLVYPSNLKNMQVYTRQQVVDLAAHIKRWVIKKFEQYSIGEYNTINEATRRQILELLVPQGDTEWVKFNYPFISRNPNNIMEKIHAKFYTSIKEEVFPKEGYEVLKFYMEATTPKQSLHFIYLNLILYLVDKHLVTSDMESLRFKAGYVIPQRDIHMYAQLLFNTQEPYIRQWMGRFYLFFNNSISTMAENIYEVIAEWILVAQYFCPTLWKSLQEFGTSMLPQELLQRTINQFTLDLVNLYDGMNIDEPATKQKEAVTVKKSRIVPIIL